MITFFSLFSISAALFRAAWIVLFSWVLELTKSRFLPWRSKRPQFRLDCILNHRYFRVLLKFNIRFSWISNIFCWSRILSVLNSLIWLLASEAYIMRGTLNLSSNQTIISYPSLRTKLVILMSTNLLFLSSLIIFSISSITAKM